MQKVEVDKITKELQERFPDIGIKSIETSNDGKATFFIEPTKKALAFLEQPGSAIKPHVFKARAATITRDAIDRTALDLAQKDPYTEAPSESIKRAIKYYYTEPLVGSALNMLAALAAKGFENDIDDPDIKNFYDVWAFDVNFEELLEWIFLDFFKTSNVYTYKVLQKYEPRVSYISPLPGKKMKKVAQKATAAKKKIWSKGFLPVAYTVLNPELVVVDGNLLFDNISIKLTLPTELNDLLKKPSGEQTQEEKDLIKALPSDLKSAAEKGGDIQLDSRLVGRVTYRKQPYERYAKPRTMRIFDTIEYNRALRRADLSTLDGISNYILKITIGSDEYPVTSQEELEAVAQLFNTPSKSFDVVWNHTLKIEKIVSPEIEAILGQEKYAQVNNDMTGGLAVTRALLDGTGDVNAAEVSLIVKGLMEEINYARRQVTRWIYREYQQIAEAVGFDRFPKIRWDEGVLKDTIMYMSTLAQLVDRRMLSYETSLEALGFDYNNELKNMEQEQQLVEDGVFGILGSPWQQAKSGGLFAAPSDGQNTPEKTPSEGRPKGQPAKKKEKETNPQAKTKNPPKTESKLVNIVNDMDDVTFAQFIAELSSSRQSNK